MTTYSYKQRILNSTPKPIVGTASNHLFYYPTPSNLNYNWSYGSLAGLFFALQIITGIFLAMHYTPHVEWAFASVEHIMTDVTGGYIFRYFHANGASMIFILIYAHMGRNLYFQSYLTRRTLWHTGVVIFLLMMATAFIGYVLPWGQMSFWGATVITSLVTAVPFVGEDIAYWVWGGFSINNATLTRFFSLHYLLPFLILGIIGGHLVLLHTDGSSDPMTLPTTPDKITFHPYYSFKDAFIFFAVFALFAALVFYSPNKLGHSDNFLPANPLVTPAHIVPEWYFTPFYAILRACPNKLGGAIGMFAAILLLFFVPYYVDARTPEALTVFAPYALPHKVLFWGFAGVFLTLMFLGTRAAAAPYVVASKLFTVLYFVYFLLAVPFLAWFNTLLITRGVGCESKPPRDVLKGSPTPTRGHRIIGRRSFHTYHRDPALQERQARRTRRGRIALQFLTLALCALLGGYLTCQEQGWNTLLNITTVVFVVVTALLTSHVILTRLERPSTNELLIPHALAPTVSLLFTVYILSILGAALGALDGVYPLPVLLGDAPTNPLGELLTNYFFSVAELLARSEFTGFLLCLPDILLCGLLFLVVLPPYNHLIILASNIPLLSLFVHSLLSLARSLVEGMTSRMMNVDVPSREMDNLLYEILSDRPRATAVLFLIYFLLLVMPLLLSALAFLCEPLWPPVTWLLGDLFTLATMLLRRLAAFRKFLPLLLPAGLYLHLELVVDLLLDLLDLLRSTDLFNEDQLESCQQTINTLCLFVFHLRYELDYLLHYLLHYLHADPLLGLIVAGAFVAEVTLSYLFYARKKPKPTSTIDPNSGPKTPTKGLYD